MSQNDESRPKPGLLSIAGASTMLAFAAAEVADARRRRRHRWRDERQHANADGDNQRGGDTYDAYGGRRLERLRDKAGDNRRGGGQDTYDDSNVSVSVDPSTGNTTVGTHNITFTRNGDGSANVLTSGISFERGPDPVATAVAPPLITDDGGVTPVPDPGDVPADGGGGNVPNPNQPVPDPGGGEPISPIS